MDRNHIAIADNGSVIEITAKTIKMGGTVPSGEVYVDGSGVGDVGAVVMRDRKRLAEDGMVVVVLPISAHDGNLLSEPEIITRGFIYVKESCKNPAPPLELGGDDDFGGLAVCHLLHGLQRLELDHRVIGRGGVEQLQRVRQGLLDLENRLGLRLAAMMRASFFALCLQNGGLLGGVRFQNQGLLLALCHRDLGLLGTLRLENGLPALLLGLHLLFHGVLDFLGRDDVLQLHPVDLDAPGVRGLVQMERILALMVSREVRDWSSSISPMMLRRVVAVRFSMAFMGRSTP